MLGLLASLDHFAFPDMVSQSFEIVSSTLSASDYAEGILSIGLTLVSRIAFLWDIFL